jgi:hypothetical protein
MPRLRKPRDLRFKHKAMLDGLGAWLAREENSTSGPVELAKQHLHKHSLQMYTCRRCGVAKAIIDCEGAIGEEAAFHFVEDIRRARAELDLVRRGLEKKVAEFRLLHERKVKANACACEFIVAREGGPPQGTTPAPSAAASTQGASGDGMESRLAPLMDAFQTWRSLYEQMNKAEEWVAGGLVSPSLAERKSQWPRDYVETKVYCYLIQHAWTPEQIAAELFPGEASASKRKSINLHAKRAQVSGKPPLIFGWPSDENKAEAARLLKVTERANRDLCGVKVLKPN